MTRRLIGTGAAVMTTLLALVALWQFQTVVLFVVVSLILAATLRPLATRLIGRGFVVRLAWILLYLVVLAGFGFVLFLSGDRAIIELQQLTQAVSAQDVWTLPVWLEGSPIQTELVARLPSPSMLFEALTVSQGQLVVPALLGFTQDIGKIVSGTLIIVFLSIYWSVGQIHFERLWLSLLPSGQRSQARSIWRVVELDLGAYIRSQAIYSISAGLLLGLGYWLIGSPSPALLALSGALVCLIPVVGGALAVLLTLLVGLLTSVEIGLFTALYTMIVFIGLSVWVKPRFFDRKWDNPILTVVLLIALADAFGLVGIIVAPPVSMVCQILWNRLVSHRLISGSAVEISDIKDRKERILSIIMEMDEPPPPLVSSSMEKLNQLILEAEPIFQTSASLTLRSRDDFAKGD